jgi:hypothetical protein
MVLTSQGKEKEGPKAEKEENTFVSKVGKTCSQN